MRSFLGRKRRLGLRFGALMEPILMSLMAIKEEEKALAEMQRQDGKGEGMALKEEGGRKVTRGIK